MYTKDRYYQFTLADFNQPIGLKMNPENRWIKKAAVIFNQPDEETPSGGSNSGSENEDSTAFKGTENKGTLMLDATCAPQNIAYPQDINLLNEARENLEEMIDAVCEEYNISKPRTYRQNARKDYLTLAKKRKRSAKLIRRAIKQQLQYVRRDLKHIDRFLEDGKDLSSHHAERLKVIRKVYEQQRYMYDNKVHSIPDRIVSISQPYVRPIVRGKAKAPVEFGIKLDMSIDEHGMVRIERQSFDAYNESDVLIGASENYRRRTGHDSQRVLVDKIYRNSNNLRYCKEHGIRLSGSALGRPRRDRNESRKITYQDAVDRIEVERGFSVTKRCYGLGLIRTKLEKTTRSSVCMSILAMNISKLTTASICDFLKSLFSKVAGQALVQFAE